jgi:hypothetical protein
VLAGKPDSGGRADGAHRQMHRAGHEVGSQTIQSKFVVSPEDNIVNCGIIRQHADDDVAFEQILDVE